METKIQIKNILGGLLFEFETENNTIIKTVKEAIKNNADIRHADFRHADLRHANFSGADFSSADFRYANFSSADFSGVILSGAVTTKRYVQIACIGSAKRLTTYCFEDNIIWCGCFNGTLEQFEIQVRETHKSNEQYLKEYLGFIKYIESLK